MAAVVRTGEHSMDAGDYGSACVLSPLCSPVHMTALSGLWADEQLYVHPNRHGGRMAYAPVFTQRARVDHQTSWPAPHALKLFSSHMTGASSHSAPVGGVVVSQDRRRYRTAHTASVRTDECLDITALMQVGGNYEVAQTPLISSELVDEMLELDLMLERVLSREVVSLDDYRRVRRQMAVVRAQASDVDKGIRAAMSYLRSARLNQSVQARHGVRELPIDDEPEAA